MGRPPIEYDESRPSAHVTPRSNFVKQHLNDSIIDCIIVSFLGDLEMAKRRKLRGVTFSRELESTLHRSLTAANERNAEFATVEHLLFALTHDKDAVSALRACAVDTLALQSRISRILDNEQPDKLSDGHDSKPTAQFQRVIQRAVIHVQSSGRTEITGANVLVALFAEGESKAARILQEFEVTRYDVVNFISHGVIKPTEKKRVLSQDITRIEKSIDTSARSAPNFRVTRSRIRFQDSGTNQNIRERKQLALERCTELQKLCAVRVNEQPDLSVLVERYATALRNLRKDRGAYKLLVVGLEIETLLRIKEKAPIDPDRNPSLGADLIFAVQSLIIAHAGLIALYPSVQNCFGELDQYRQQSEAIDALRDRILDPVLGRLATAQDVFDESTQEQTKEIARLSDLDNMSTMPSRGVESMKHAWLRGALASMGQYVLTQTKKIAAAARDAATKELVSAATRNSDRLLGSIIVFFEGAKTQLLTLADTLTHSFGWIRSLLDFLAF